MEVSEITLPPTTKHIDGGLSLQRCDGHGVQMPGDPGIALVKAVKNSGSMKGNW